MGISRTDFDVTSAGYKIKVISWEFIATPQTIVFACNIATPQTIVFTQFVVLRCIL